MTSMRDADTQPCNRRRDPDRRLARSPTAELRAAARRALDRVWTAIETRLAALAERANPILVKETRQALKSRQFVVTFLIVLVACWIVSFARRGDHRPADLLRRGRAGRC